MSVCVTLQTAIRTADTENNQGRQGLSQNTAHGPHRTHYKDRHRTDHTHSQRTQHKHSHSAQHKHSHRTQHKDSHTTQHKVTQHSTKTVTQRSTNTVTEYSAKAATERSEQNKRAHANVSRFISGSVTPWTTSHKLRPYFCFAGKHWLGKQQVLHRAAVLSW